MPDGARSFDWTTIDRQVEAAEAIGAKPMIVLGRTPRFASSRPRADDYYVLRRRLRAWKTYVTRWPGDTEPDWSTRCGPSPTSFRTGRGRRDRWLTLTMVAAKAITTHVGAKAKVISPAVAVRLTSRETGWQRFQATCRRKRVQAYVDAVALDPFPEKRGTPEDSYRLVLAVKRQLARIGVRKPLWNNEINYGVAGALAETTLCYSIDKQQAYVIRTYALSAAARMQRTYWPVPPRHPRRPDDRPGGRLRPRDGTGRRRRPPPEARDQLPGLPQCRTRGKNEGAARLDDAREPP